MTKQQTWTLVAIGVAVLIGGVIIYQKVQKKPDKSGDSDKSDKKDTTPPAPSPETTGRTGTGGAPSASSETAFNGMVEEMKETATMSAAQIEVANQKREGLNAKVKALTEELRKLPKTSGYRDHAINLKNHIALLNAQIRLT